MVLLAAAWALPHVRHVFIEDVTTWDAVPSPAAPLPAAKGAGLTAAPRVRVILIDGLSAETAKTLPTWSALCKRGLSLTVDVGFPTISLPVEAALWSGLTQQQTGIVFRSDRALVPPLVGIPSHVPDSHAVAENHAYIVRSLGFAKTEGDETKDWAGVWQQHAHDAVAGAERLVFVHVLRVDTAGHHHGRDSAEYRQSASEADAILASLVDAAPDARWFLLSDHGHRGPGGHGGEEREVRQVQHCIFGPDLAPATGGPVHVVDMARALADSLDVTLDARSLARPLHAAIAAPLSDDQAVPATALGPGVAALFVLVIGGVVSAFGVRRWWLAPWWFVLACASLVVVRGLPTLSMPMVYAPAGRAMYVTWLPALVLAAVTAYAGISRVGLLRVLASQLALPIAAMCAAFTVTRAWASLFGAYQAPVVPRFTAWTSPLILIAAHGLTAVALAVLGSSVRLAFGRPSRPEPPRIDPASG